MESYAEDPQIEVKTLGLIRDYINRFYGNYGSLRAHGFSKDELESDVCFYVYKVSKKGETFLDKMSKIKDEKHHRAFVKRSVLNMILSRDREMRNKPLVMSLDYNGDGVQDYRDECLGESVGDRTPDPRAFIEDDILLGIALDNIENKVYDNIIYSYEENKEKPLELKDIISWVLENKDIGALPRYLSYKTGKKKVPIKWLRNELYLAYCKLEGEDTCY